MQRANSVVASPVSKVELRFECEKLPNLDTLSKSDPQVIVYQRSTDGREWREVGRTEIIKDNLNPKFSRSVVMPYFFEKNQYLKFVVIDIDSSSTNVADHDLVGEVECTMGDIVGSRGSRLVKKIVHHRRSKNGVLIVYAQELEESKMEIDVDISCDHLDKKDFFGKSDPFVEISASRPDGTWMLIHRTEYILKTLSPHFRKFTLPQKKLTGGSDQTPIRFQVFDWNKSGKSDFIGEFTASLGDLKKQAHWDLINPKKRSKKSYKNSGVLNINLKFQPAFSFLDYIMGGTEINLVCAIDYTASNGDPKFSSSLHYRNPYTPNEYEKAIKAVGDILMQYDSDGNVPLFGFGAKVNGHTSHCFNVNLRSDTPEVPGVSGMLQAYQNSFQSGAIQLYGPTNFSPIIKKAAEIAKDFYDNKDDVQAYLILLIITDGEITDMSDTIHEIVSASYLPMSIVIVGVGPADFSKMDILDGDVDGTGILKSNNRPADRDIVQFVPFRDFKDKDVSFLAAETLREIPEQFVGFMKKHKIRPHPPPSAAQIAQMQQQQISNLMRAGSSVVGLPPSSAAPSIHQPAMNPNQYPGSPQPTLSRAPSSYPNQSYPQQNYPPPQHPQSAYPPPQHSQSYMPSAPGPYMNPQDQGGYGGGYPPQQSFSRSPSQYPQQQSGGGYPQQYPQEHYGAPQHSQSYAPGGY